MQQGDVQLYQTTDGGETTVTDGVVVMTGGLETAAYLSMFGGNEDDDGREGNRLTWWGNLDENEFSRQYRSETQYLLRSIPATSGNLRRIEDAAKRDLAWFLEEKVASSVEVSVALIAVNTIQIDVNISALGEESNFSFVENWKNAE